MDNAVFLENVESKTESQIEYTASELQADTLFNFVDDIKFIIQPLQQKMLTPRYCIEDVKYMELDGIERIAFPMKCFCDINFHRIGTHLNWYGYYGLAFNKEWGIRKGIQPVQYINRNSVQRQDFTEALNLALNTLGSSKNNIEKSLKSFLLEQLMYYKPYDGVQYYKPEKEDRKKCFADECEWRYIPDVAKIGLPPMYYKSTVQQEALNRLSDSMNMNPEVSLHFDYADLKYIVLKYEADFEKTASTIMNLKCDEGTKYKLISKILVWENDKGDF